MTATALVPVSGEDMLPRSWPGNSRQHSSRSVTDVGRAYETYTECPHSISFPNEIPKRLPPCRLTGYPPAMPPILPIRRGALFALFVAASIASSAQPRLITELDLHKFIWIADAQI